MIDGGPGGRGAQWAVRLAVLVAATAFAAGGAGAQELADFDYEDLSVRGLGFEAGYIWPTRVDPVETFGVRMDLGYLGPGLRILPRVGWWSSFLDDAEIQRLEGRVESLVDGATPPATPPVAIDLREIEWSALVLGLDAQFVWSIPFDLLSYAGLGVAAHVQNGSGPAIDGTFVEDLLDGTVAAINVHGGLEYPISDRIRIFGTARYEVMGDLRYTQIGAGLQFMFKGPAPGEERSR